MGQSFYTQAGYDGEVSRDDTRGGRVGLSRMDSISAIFDGFVTRTQGKDPGVLVQTSSLPWRHTGGTMQNYRVTFGGETIDYHSNFADCRGYWPMIREILNVLDAYGVENKWWFFEPYVEITWICDDPVVAAEAMNAVSKALGDLEHKKFTPADGIFGDWHGLSPEEREFGARRYSELAKTARYYYENMATIKRGLGLEKHYARTTHVLANQLGMNYEEEGIALLKRGFLAILFWHLGHEKAVATYEKLFKEKYLGRDEDLS